MFINNYAFSFINLGAYFFQKKDKISDEIVFLFLLFDTSQLGVLLF